MFKNSLNFIMLKIRLILRCKQVTKTNLKMQTIFKILRCKHITKTGHAEQRIRDSFGLLGNRSPALLYFALLCFTTPQQADRWPIPPSPMAPVYYYLKDLAKFTFNYKYTTMCNVRGFFNLFKLKAIAMIASETCFTLLLFYSERQDLAILFEPFLLKFCVCEIFAPWAPLGSLGSSGIPGI
jgi:hypothetical protein